MYRLDNINFLLALDRSRKTRGCIYASRLNVGMVELVFKE